MVVSHTRIEGGLTIEALLIRSLRAFYLAETTTVGGQISTIARNTTEAKGCNFQAGFLQVFHMFLKHLLKVCSKSLTRLQEVYNNNVMKSLSSPSLTPNKTFTSHDSSPLQVSNIQITSL